MVKLNYYHKGYKLLNKDFNNKPPEKGSAKISNRPDYVVAIC